MSEPDNNLDDIVERLIDEEGLLNVMLSAAEVCRLKAAHIRENWQDNELAKRWVRAAKRLESMQVVLSATGSTATRVRPKKPPAEAVIPTETPDEPTEPTDEEPIA